MRHRRDQFMRRIARQHRITVQGDDVFNVTGKRWAGSLATLTNWFAGWRNQLFSNASFPRLRS
jgi:hypothetical protein